MRSVPLALGRSPEALPAATRVGEYIVAELVAEGGFALLYRARRAAGSEIVALKVLRRELTFVGNGVSRFHREVDALHELRHPNVVNVLAHGDLPDGRPYLAMEWLGGQNLETQLAQGGALALTDVLAVTAPLASALDAAHALGIVHRDVNARNVMMAPRAEAVVPVLVDFGVAHWGARDRAAGFSSHSIVGSPCSMAPEQILGQAVDARTDVYALGVLLFQMATGVAPFRSSDAIELEEMHLVGAPPVPSHLAPLPAAFDALVARCLAKAMTERPASAGSVVSLLRQTFPAPVGGGVVAVHVELRLDPAEGEPEDADLDVIDRALEHARADLAERRFLPIAVHARALLATSGSGEEVASAARTLVSTLDAITAGSRVEVLVTLHADHPAALRRTGTWVTREPGFWISAAARSGDLAAGALLQLA